MKCHYEVLCIPRDADDVDIKSSYRKLALRWHPDKNLDNLEIATTNFQLIQQAYEVLSDSHERAWYDNHRHQILHGSHTNYQDNSLDVFQYFTASCYKGYGDDETGFYYVYNNVFLKVATEDIEFLDSDSDFDDIPKFGISTSDYEEIVGPFYAYWQSYCTKKSYSWLCPHNIQEVRDRRLLREIEKETKKIAQKARKERNEEIRALVAFVRKRDKRVQKQKKVLEEKAELNRTKQQQKRLEQIQKNQIEVEKMRKHQTSVFSTAGHEEQLRQMEEAYASTDDDCDDNEMDSDNEMTKSEQSILQTEVDDYIDHLYCVACNKSFKNECSYQNHELSKKHKDNIQRLKIEMCAEDNSYEKTSEDEDATREDSLSDEKILVKIKKSIKKDKSKKKVQKVVDPFQEEIPDLLNIQLDDENNWSDDGKKIKKITKAKKSVKTDTKNKKTDVNDLEHTETVIENSIDISHTCVTCNSFFESKNKLFNHLKKTSHGVYIPKSTVANTPNNSKRSKKKQ